MKTPQPQKIIIDLNPSFILPSSPPSQKLNLRFVFLTANRSELANVVSEFKNHFLKYHFQSVLPLRIEAGLNKDCFQHAKINRRSEWRIPGPSEYLRKLRVFHSFDAQISMKEP